MAPEPTPATKTALRSRPWKHFAKTENLLDLGINKKYQDTVFYGFTHTAFGGEVAL